MLYSPLDVLRVFNIVVYYHSEIFVLATRLYIYLFPILELYCTAEASIVLFRLICVDFHTSFSILFVSCATII